MHVSLRGILLCVGMNVSGYVCGLLVHASAKIPSYSPPCETGQTGVLVFPLTVGVHFFIFFACRVD